MLNKLGRKKISVKVGKLRTEGNTSGLVYTQEALDGAFRDYAKARGQTESMHTFEESPFVKCAGDTCLRVTIDMSHLDGLELHLPVSGKQRTFEEIVPGPLRDIQDKLAEGFGNTLKETAGIEPQPVRLSTDWSDLD